MVCQTEHPVGPPKAFSLNLDSFAEFKCKTKAVNFFISLQNHWTLFFQVCNFVRQYSSICEIAWVMNHVTNTISWLLPQTALFLGNFLKRSYSESPFPWVMDQASFLAVHSLVGQMCSMICSEWDGSHSINFWPFAIFFVEFLFLKKIWIYSIS